jgi:uncharacterized protein involved in exopolysaccharide biosynthesis
MTDHPLATRERANPEFTSVIPLDFVHPGLSMAQIASIVWAHRKLTFLIVLAVLSCTVLVMALWPRTYTATASLMVNYEVSDPLNGKELPVGQLGSYISTQVELMQTPEVVLSVVDRLKLTENPDHARGYKGETGTLQEWVAAKVSKRLSIYQSQRGSQLIYVTYSANDPRAAAQVANAVVDVYKEQDNARSTGPLAERAKRYSQQLGDLKSKVDQAQAQVTAFHQRNGLIDEGNKSNVDVSLLAALDERLLVAQNARRIAELRAAEDPSVSDQVLASTQAISLKAQLATQEQRLAQLNRLYTPLYPDIAEAQQQVEATRRALASTVKSYSDNASAGLGTARQIETGLQRVAQDHRARVLAKGQLQDESAKISLELESAQAVYKRALDGYDQIMFAAGRHPTNVNVVSRATPPLSASNPRVLAGYLLGIGAAFLLGLGIPLVMELFNRRVRCRDDLERHLGIPVLVEFGRLPTRVTA